MPNQTQYIQTPEPANKNITWLTLVILTVLAAILVFIYTRYDGSDPGVRIIASENSATSENCISDECLEVSDLEYPVADLPSEVVNALNSAADDEYLARATYEAVIDEIGAVRPFSMIIRAEEQHLLLLKSIYDKYGLEVPADPYTSTSALDTKTANCAVGLQAEINNAELYQDRLLPTVIDYPDITSVFTKLMNDSQTKHLPAFERCAR